MKLERNDGIIYIPDSTFKNSISICLRRIKSSITAAEDFYLNITLADKTESNLLLDSEEEFQQIMGYLDILFDHKKKSSTSPIFTEEVLNDEYLGTY